MKQFLHVCSGTFADNHQGSVYYFIHNSDSGVPTLTSVEEADQVVPGIIEFGFIDTSPIFNLEDSLKQVCVSSCFISIYVHIFRTYSLSS